MPVRAEASVTTAVRPPQEGGPQIQYRDQGPVANPQIRGEVGKPASQTLAAEAGRFAPAEQDRLVTEANKPGGDFAQWTQEQAGVFDVVDLGKLKVSSSITDRDPDVIDAKHTDLFDECLPSIDTTCTRDDGCKKD